MPSAPLLLCSPSWLQSFPPNPPSPPVKGLPSVWKLFFFFFWNFILFYFLYSRFLLVIRFIHISVYMSVPISQFITSPTPATFPAWCPYICSLHLCLYFCPANRFICTIFLASTYMRLETFLPSQLPPIGVGPIPLLLSLFSLFSFALPMYVGIFLLFGKSQVFCRHSVGVL